VILSMLLAGVWLAQAQAPAPESGLLQYGAIGLLALVALAAGWRLFTRQIQMHERDIARADKAEEELSKLNALIREQLVAQLTQTATALSRAADVLTDQTDKRRGAR
jgi:hypothetical protein